MIKDRYVTALAPTVCEALGVTVPTTATDDGLSREELPAGFYNASRILILVLDSWGELNWRQAIERTPFLEEIDKQYRIGTLLSTLPSITPVNFTAIGTGAHLASHGVESRDQRTSLQTIFEVTAKEGKTSSVVGPANSSSVLVLGPTASHCLTASTKKDSNAEVALMLANHLHQHQPDLALSQWLDLDSVGHDYGPHSEEHLRTYESTDALLRHFIPLARRLGYWILLTADHGMHPDESGDPGNMGSHGGDSPVDTVVPLWVIPPIGERND